MHRLSAAKACFLSNSTEGTPKPDELLKTLEEVNIVEVHFYEICDSSLKISTIPN